MNQSFDAAILIGRFQPFHHGHAMLLQHALTVAPRVLVMLGSAFAARNAKNPFTWQERVAMISQSLDAAQQARVSFIPLRDYYNLRRWNQALHQQVQTHLVGAQRVALVGHIKDQSSAYLHQLFDWTLQTLPAYHTLSATQIREHYFLENDNAELAQLVPPAVFEYLQTWKKSSAFFDMQEEFIALKNYQKTWGKGPFVTVDAVVMTTQQVLLIQRRHAPGKNLWALPGGFLEPHENLLHAAIRELQEETQLNIAYTALEAALKNVVVFDHPQRSIRGRTITHVHHFVLKKMTAPHVAGADDAKCAHWVPITELKTLEDKLFEDHFHILNHFFALVD